jgi:hypothetical protein
VADAEADEDCSDAGSESGGKAAAPAELVGEERTGED